jgi:hypothetical protein
MLFQVKIATKNVKVNKQIIEIIDDSNPDISKYLLNSNILWISLDS